MPDGLTHILASYIGGQHWLKNGRLTVFLIGSLMPDILLRGGRLLFEHSSQKDFLELYLMPLHTPFTCLVVCIALAQLFKPGIRKSACMMLYAGCLTHFILDIFQRTINGVGLTLEPLDSYHWLYPFSWYDFQIGFFWAENTSYALTFLIPLTGWIWLKGRGEE